MAESVFKAGTAGPGLKGLTPEDSNRKDEYGGKYKDAAQTMSEQEKFGTNLIPVTNPPLPARNLKGAG